jgi:hypothetical protein
MRIGWLVNAEHFVTTTPFPNCRIHQPPNAHVRISGILLSNTMEAAPVKKIYAIYFHWKARNLDLICYQCRQFDLLAVSSAELDDVFWNIVQIVNKNNFSSNIFPSTSYFLRKCVQMRSSAQMMSSARVWCWTSQHRTLLRIWLNDDKIMAKWPSEFRCLDSITNC